MSILIDENTRILVQGITGNYGQKQVETMVRYGTGVVAGTSPGKGGSRVNGIPVYDTVAEASAAQHIDASIIYVPPYGVREAALEALDNGIKLIMIAAEGVPLHDCMEIRARAEEKNAWVVGPNTIGLISPEKCLMGSLGAAYAKKGKVGLVTRGGTIAIEMVRILSEEGIGQSTCIGSGGDRVLGKNPAEYLRLFEADPETEVVMLVGEIGGLKENQCADIIRAMKKKVIVYILGRCAPKGARMGHIGAIISKGGETFTEKCRVLEEAGAIIVNTPWEAVDAIRQLGIA